MLLNSLTIPEYLKKSKLFQIISKTNEEFEVPEKYIVPINHIVTNDDWIKLVEIYNYWNLVITVDCPIIVYGAAHLDSLCKEYFPRFSDELIFELEKLFTQELFPALDLQWSRYWFSMVLFHHDKDWSYSHLSENPNLKYEIVVENPEIKWNYNHMSDNINITWDIVSCYPDKPWNFYRLSSHPNITWEIVQANPDKPWVYHALSRNPNITWDIVRKNPHINWSFTDLIQNINISWEIPPILKSARASDQAPFHFIPLCQNGAVIRPAKNLYEIKLI